MNESLLPTDRELEKLFTRTFADRLAGDTAAVLERTPLGQGSFPKEILKLGLGEDTIELFCKYEGGFDHSAHGHRGGVPYESRVYEEILGPGGHDTVDVVRVHRPEDRADTWLFLRLVPGALRVSKVPEPGAMAAAAAWAGRFHGRTSGTDVPSFVTRYDRDYYLGWIERTDANVQEGGGAGAWWADVVRRFEEHLPILDDPEACLIHGEYYPKNVLWSAGRIYPVDWESMALGPGVVDLVRLVDRWPRVEVERCTEAYVRNRWPSGAPAWFADQRPLAEMYLQFHWLGEAKDAEWKPEIPAQDWPRVRRIREVALDLGWM